MKQIWTLITVVAVLTGTPWQAAAKPTVLRFNMDRWRFSTTYTWGGETKLQVKRRTKAAVVTNLAYFNMNDGKPIQAIDLYYQAGTYRKAQRWDWGRPILVIAKSGLRIDRPKKNRRWKPSKGDLAAVALDDHEQPRRRMPRQVIALKGRMVYLIQDRSATWAQMRNKLRRLGLRNYASFDGGHSLGRNAKAATHFCATWGACG
jgi:hypothetical protein